MLGRTHRECTVEPMKFDLRVESGSPLATFRRTPNRETVPCEIGRFPGAIMKFPSAGPSDQSKSCNGYAIQNEILLALPKDESAVLLSKLTAVSLKHQLQLHEAGQLVEFCYFPNTCTVSILTFMADGKSIEVGLAGRESFIGASLLGGFRTSGNWSRGTGGRNGISDRRRNLPQGAGYLSGTEPSAYPQYAQDGFSGQPNRRL